MFGCGLGFLTLGLVTAGTLADAAAAAPVVAPSAQPAGVSAEAVVAKVAPAVVTVVNEQRYNAGAQNQLQPVGSGTGFVIDNDGHIVTNWHVVQGGDKFFVIFSDGTKEDAKLVGSDEVSDVAVVQVASHPKTTLTFGDSNALKPGQPVLAIGSPLGSFS